MRRYIILRALENRVVITPCLDGINGVSGADSVSGVDGKSWCW